MLMKFDYGNHPVRTVAIDGEPWFVASDVAQILGYRDAPNLARRIDEDDKGTHSVSTPGGAQKFTIISEPGLYIAVFGSKAESAKNFKRWVAHDVIPSIRKTGSYVAPKSREEQLSNAVLLAQELIKEKQSFIESLEPRAEAWDSVVGSAASWSFNDAAKSLFEQHKIVIGEKRLVKWLVEQQLLYRDVKRRPHAYQRYVESGVFTVKARTYRDHFTGEIKESDAPQVRITGKGLDVIRKRLLSQAQEVAA